jgi:hypothetical protein
LTADQGIDLKWGHLYYTDQFANVHYGDTAVNYTVIATKDKRARLDTQCALRKEISAHFVMASFDVENQNKFNFKMPIPGERYYVNVIAKVKSEMEEEAELIPYKPIEIYIPPRSIFSRFALCKKVFSISCCFIVIFVVIVLAFVSGALYFYRKGRETEQRIEYEMADVRS